MNAIRYFLLLFICISIAAKGQEKKFPKDTIYVKYMPKADKEKWHGKFTRSYRGNKGIFFNIKDIDGDMVLFYNQKNKTDTLCTLHINNYKTLSLEEINRKEWKWYKKKFGGQPPFGNKNGVFVTYLVEVISQDKFVIYPVVWRNEGAID